MLCLLEVLLERDLPLIKTIFVQLLYILYLQVEVELDPAGGILAPLAELGL